ncbi:MAG: hypothetical protein JXR73_05930 [Candidatus Omnitrophica bacterium]|nr:hypothetical protein [Candidatus Omnitrophota bacterium]
MRKRYAYVLGIIFIILIITYLGLKTAANTWLRNAFGPQLYAQMNEFFNNPVDLPDEYFQNRTAEPAALEAGKNIDALYEKYQISQFDLNPFESIRENKPLTDEEKQKLNRDLQNAKPFLDALLPFSARPDYEMGAWALYENGVLPNFQTMQISAKCLLLRAHASAEAGRWREAFENALAVHRLSKRHPASYLITHLVAIAMQNMASHAVMTYAPSCADADALQTALSEMNRLDQDINLSMLEKGLIIDFIVELSRFQQEDPSIDLTPGRKGRYYFRQYMDHILSKQVDGSLYDNSPPAWMIKLARSLGFRRQVDQLFYGISTPNIQNAVVREKTAVSKYHIAQITLASRLYEIKTGNPPARLADLAPDYLNRRPVDPFADHETGSDYRFQPARKIFYGLGPDGADNQSQILYDPSNGTMSAGDIFSERQ